MKKYKLNWRYWFFCLLFIGILTLGIRVLLMVINGEIVDESGAVVEFDLLLAPIVLVLFTYFITVVSLLKILFQNKGCGLLITDRGIENTVVFIALFAFVIVVPVKLIPWEAIKYCDKGEKSLYIRVYKKEIEAGFFAKLIISVLGYSFCQGFIKPDVTEEDIEKYKHRFSLKNNL